MAYKNSNDIPTEDNEGIQQIEKKSLRNCVRVCRLVVNNSQCIDTLQNKAVLHPCASNLNDIDDEDYHNIVNQQRHTRCTKQFSV